MTDLILPALAALIIALALIKLFQYSITCLRLMKIRLKPCSNTHWVKQIDRSDIPIKIEQILAKAETPLTALCFQYAFAERIEGFYTNDKEPYYSHVYYNPDTNTYASVLPSVLPETGQLYSVELTTFLSTSEIMTTMNGFSHYQLSTPAWYHCHDHYVASLEQQWHNHCQTLNNTPIQPTQPRVDDYIAMQNRFYNELLTTWREKGWLVATCNNLWRYSFLAALKLTFKISKGHRKLQSVLKQNPPKTTESDINTQIATEVQAFERLVAAENNQQHSGWLVKTLLFLLSVLVFSVAFGLVFSWYTVLILLGVLMVHEFGHLLGMRLFGYRDLFILFIPLLGAVATGKKEEATPTQKLIVYLLGPVPGLVFGLMALQIGQLTHHALWTEIGLIAVLLNYVNLLPITPLDGGRIMETLFFVRFPRAQFVFVVLSILTLAVGAWWLESIVLSILVILLSFIIPTQWRWSQAAAQIAKTLPRDANRETRLRLILQTLSQPPHHQQAFTTRFHTAKSLLQHFYNPLPTLKVSVLGGLIYLLILGMPIYLVFNPLSSWLNLGPLVALFDTTACGKYSNEPDWDAQLNQADSDEARWEILMKAGQCQREVWDYQKAQQYYQRALRIAEKQFPRSDERVVDTLVQLAAHSETEASHQYYQNALTRLEQHHGSNHPRIADILEATSLELSATPEKQIEQLKRAIHIRAINGLAQTPKNALTWERLGYAYAHAGQREAAKHALQRSFAITEPNEAPSRHLLMAIESLATFYLNQQQPKEVQQLLENQLVPPQFNNTTHLAYLLGWAYLLQEQLPKARAAFEKALASARQRCETSVGSSIRSYFKQKPGCDASGWYLTDYLFNLAYIELRLQNTEALDKYIDEIKQTYKNDHQSMANYADYLQGVIAQNTQPNHSWLFKRTTAQLEVYQYILSKEQHQVP
jgi:tetratricopeptide (TPR) repeat protein